MRSAIELARAGNKSDARDIFMRVVDDDPQNELAWMWLAGLVDSLEDKIIACENVLVINPSNAKVQAYLDKLKHRKHAEEAKADIPDASKPADPLDVGKFLEQEGKFEEALNLYKVEAAKAKDTNTFDELYRRISRIEQMQNDRIRYVSPNISIARLTFTWPLLYLSLALVQVGLNPIKNLVGYLWFSFPLVLVGSYFVAVSEVRSRHMIWRELFSEQGDGSTFARLAVAAIGWLMILIPLGLIFLDSLNRLSDFQIPPKVF